MVGMPKYLRHTFFFQRSTFAGGASAGNWSSRIFVPVVLTTM
jgi:hypothetical protein